MTAGPTPSITSGPAGLIPGLTLLYPDWAVTTDIIHSKALLSDSKLWPSKRADQRLGFIFKDKYFLIGAVEGTQVVPCPCVVERAEQWTPVTPRCLEAHPVVFGLFFSFSTSSHSHFF